MLKYLKIYVYIFTIFEIIKSSVFTNAPFSSLLRKKGLLWSSLKVLKQVGKIEGQENVKGEYILQTHSYIFFSNLFMGRTQTKLYKRPIFKKNLKKNQKSVHT